ncbi:nitrate/sulfonate/bicarbonate ABC transporter ATP-binding protein [Pollutimonas nitritireducens]|uniref:Nitrate/sulfonate/bicarbonate ABC transporter ATP-binding protein n=1 Tax=Pollutimonas nitritireducens TaxID=2045209 RepID=A0A2N4UJW0_9BURK|nr:ABC transporter ATP-binding protein [Pollutimonas nitritireducens]PLC55290.1 nitrate/sulfonate/bicarbonate ABC transporter ATP-binding protein [Pollutimonas nitritireducens]
MASQIDMIRKFPASEVDRKAHVAVNGATKVFAARDGGLPLHALGPVSFDLRQGEFFSVVGPSGCGKSTLLDLVAGLSPPTEGSVFFEHKEVKGQVPDGVAVVFQEDASFPWLSVFDNAAFGARRSGLPENEVKERVDHALAFMGLASFAASYPAQLSGGMRQRVCIARAMVLRPRLMLLDEPFGALDQQTRLLMGEEMLKLWRETDSTVMLITHSIDEAVMLSDRVGIMSARPGTFIDIVETGWSRERGSETTMNPHYGALQSKVWGLLRTESLKALGV